MDGVVVSVSDAIALFNQTLDYAYPSIAIEGEVASFKVNQGKYVFFDIKDSEGTLNCFMMLFSLRVPIEDGMRVRLTATPKLTTWGRFSLTVRSIRPVGEGSLKKSFELLKAKLDKEGLFAHERKRILPALPQRIAIISSTQAAGYQDFIKIINQRWGGLDIQTAHVQVQGEAAAEQIRRAIKYFNEQAQLPDVLVIVRGGGSADDLAAFNDEPLVREMAASRVPVLTGIGHEIDITLADLVADKRAATPSHAAEILVPSREELIRSTRVSARGVRQQVLRLVDDYRLSVSQSLEGVSEAIGRSLAKSEEHLKSIMAVARQLSPEVVLQRGYALVRGEPVVGSSIEVETRQAILRAEVTNVKQR